MLPHAIPELTALFLPLAAWLIASRRGEWNQLLAATFITVALAIPALVLAADDRGLRLAAHPRAALAGGSAPDLLAVAIGAPDAPLHACLVRSPLDERLRAESDRAQVAGRSGPRRRPGRSPTPASPASTTSKPKSYVLEMLPYPSGEPHVGHLKCYAVGDAIAHFRRRHGFEVIHPMGYDSFGLPAENNAIKTGEPPRVATERSIDSFRRQFREWGISIDWSRELATHTPEYYRWTQWIFLQLFEQRPRLPHRGAGPVVPEGRDRAGQRAGRRRPLRALRHRGRAAQASSSGSSSITDYADRLLADFDAARVLARARDHDAAQLDRPLRGRRGRLPLRGGRPRLPGLHHPSRHPLRRHLLRPRPRAPRAGAPGRRHPGRGGGARVRQPGRPRVGRGARRRGPREDRRAARAQRSSTRSTARRSRCSSPTTC